MGSKDPKGLRSVPMIARVILFPRYPMDPKGTKGPKGPRTQRAMGDQKDPAEQRELSEQYMFFQTSDQID